MNPVQVIDEIILYRLGEVNALTHALNLCKVFYNPKTIEIYFDNKLTIVGNSTAYTNPVIELFNVAKHEYCSNSKILCIPAARTK